MKRKNLKIILLMAAVLFSGLTMNAQKKVSYHEDYKYDLVSNLQIGVGGIYTNQIFTNREGNFGLDVRIMKRVGKNFRLREIAQVNGFKNTGTFDRYGKLMTGISLDFIPALYMYGDFGAVYNPSNKTKFGLAMDGGLGANIRLSDYALIYTEVGVDRVQHNENWTSNGAVTVGFMIEPGITQSDKHNIQIADNMPHRFEELGLQVQAAEKINKEYRMTLDTMNRTLIEANNMIGKLRKEIAKCELEKEECGKGLSSDFPDIFFGFGSAALNDIELDKLISIADMMSKTSDQYVLYGYCSYDGQDNTNLKLAEDRCYKVVLTLEKFGIDSWRFLEVVPVGKQVTYGDGSGSANRFVRIVKK